MCTISREPGGSRSGRPARWPRPPRRRRASPGWARCGNPGQRHVQHRDVVRGDVRPGDAGPQQAGPEPPRPRRGGPRSAATGGTRRLVSRCHRVLLLFGRDRDGGIDVRPQLLAQVRARHPRLAATTRSAGTRPSACSDASRQLPVVRDHPSPCSSAENRRLARPADTVDPPDSSSPIRLISPCRDTTMTSRVSRFTVTGRAPAAAWPRVEQPTGHCTLRDRHRQDRRALRPQAACASTASTCASFVTAPDVKRALRNPGCSRGLKPPVSSRQRAM